MAIDIIARGMIESSKNDISQLFDITKGGEIVNNESSYTLNNAVDYPLLRLDLYGKSTQDGTPTPENPVDIVSVGDSGSVEVSACGKNLFDYTRLADTAYNGITFKNNNDGSFTVSGKKADTSKHFSAYKDYTHAESINILTAGKYTISSSLTPNSNLYGYVNLYYNGNSFYSVATTTENGKKTFAITEDMLSYDDFRFQIGFYSPPNKDVITGTFNLQLEHGDTATDFEPYKGNIASITSSLPLCGIPVSEGGNYTDSNGQQWACDELIYNADGTGKIVKNIRKYTFTGADEGGYWFLNSTVDTTKKRFQFKFTDENIKPVYDSDKFTNKVQSRIFCDKYQALKNVDTYECINGITVSHTAGYIAVYDENYSTISTINDWIAYLAENPITVVYQLNTPQEIELSAAEISALKQLQTFNGVTNIFNDGGADMTVKFCTNNMLSEYVLPITTGLQKQIDELKSAVLSLGGNV